MTFKPANILPIRSDLRDKYDSWLVAPGGRHRDSDAIERANYRAMTERILMNEPLGDDWDILRFGHWAVGWIEEIVVRPGTHAYELAVEAARQLENYPILDEHIFAEEESDEYND